MRKERMKQAATDGSDTTIVDSRGDGGKLESALTRETVEKLAYQYWLDRGCPEGSAAEDWLQAERTLLATAVKAGQPDSVRRPRGRTEQVQSSTLGAVMSAGG
jgi:hypothetical protein